jgi:two-component system, chemotaxis family, protein-glutamate methylesterase/glutaminase
MSVKVLIVDDTIVYRKIVGDALTGVPDIEIVGTASNGKIALSRIGALHPDLLVLDIEMPEMTGLEVLAAIREKDIDVGAIVLSALTIKGGEMTLKALELGAFDFVTKPEGLSQAENHAEIRSRLIPLIKAFGQVREVKSILKGVKERPSTLGPSHSVMSGNNGAVKQIAPRPTVDFKSKGLRARSEAIGIGISTGGPQALSRMLPQLPADLNVPIFIVQHMPPTFTKSLADSLNTRCKFRVKEAEDGETVQANMGYIAPGGKQMRVTLGVDALTKIIRVTDDPPENHCKPSVDYLFRSLAHHYVGRATGVVMTGMGNDGMEGAKLLKRNGAFVIAQDEESCTVFGMPKEVIQAGAADLVASLDDIAHAVVRTVKY